jgi:hypothetical protein
MTLFNVYILYKKIISQKLKYNQFRLVMAEELLDGLITHNTVICKKRSSSSVCPLGFRQLIWPTFHSIYPQIL